MTIENKATWENGKDFENDFWENWIATKGDKWPEEFASRMDPNLSVGNLIAGYLSTVTHTPRILDVGAGPLSFIGKVMPDGKKIELTPIDPLANSYTAMFKKSGITPPVPTLLGEVEKLDLYFKPNTFDLVFMRNALDHSYDPLAGIKQMIGVVKKGQVVILEHAANEAEKANYVGFHQWNICMENNEFILWNKSARINVSEELKQIAKFAVTGDSDWTMAIIEKL